MSQTALLTGPMVNPFPHQITVFECIQLAGTQANWALITALALQVFYSLFLLQLAQTAVMSHFTYAILVLKWGSSTRFRRPPVVELDVSYLRRLERIYILKGDRLWARFVAWIIVLLALMQSLAGIINEVRIANNEEVSKLKNFLTGARVWLIGSAVCDILITSSMIFIVRGFMLSFMAPSLTSPRVAQSVPQKNSMEADRHLTTIVAIVEAILFVLFPKTNLGQFPAFMLGPLYALLLVVSLNSRADMAPASLIATPYTEEINWGRPDPEQATDLEALRAVHITARVSTERTPRMSWRSVSTTLVVHPKAMKPVYAELGIICDLIPGFCTQVTCTMYGRQTGSSSSAIRHMSTYRRSRRPNTNGDVFANISAVQDEWQWAARMYP
ncbi:hypothetical protein B0H14DRAFT_2629527 [Mycena olivaceomarginata]|nr:hypothetical protein B0H14DRAFT_2629527 [Mycena olivaceomarginata]